MKHHVAAMTGTKGRRPGMVTADAAGRPRLRAFGRSVPMPRTWWLRVGIGVLFVIGGLAAFLPIFGLWMIPVGLVVLSIDVPLVRRWRRRADVWLHRRYPETMRKLGKYI